MRPAVLEHGHRLRARLFMGLVRALTRQRLDAVAQLALYRPRFFGDPMFTFGSDVLRGPSYWTPGEREYLAVYTSRLNECPFCIRIHTETTRLESGGVIDVDGTGSVRPQVAAVLPLLEKVDAACEAAGRSPVTLERSAAVIVEVGPHKPSAMTGPPLTGSSAEIAAGLRAYADAGLSHVQVWLEPNTPAGIEAFVPVLEELDRPG